MNTEGARNLLDQYEYQKVLRGDRNDLQCEDNTTYNSGVVAVTLEGLHVWRTTTDEQENSRAYGCNGCADQRNNNARLLAPVYEQLRLHSLVPRQLYPSWSDQATYVAYLRTMVQASVAGLKRGLGYGLGAIVGGVSYATLGPRRCFLAGAALPALSLFFPAILPRINIGGGLRKQGVGEEGLGHWRATGYHEEVGVSIERFQSCGAGAVMRVPTISFASTFSRRLSSKNHATTFDVSTSLVIEWPTHSRTRQTFQRRTQAFRMLNEKNPYVGVGFRTERSFISVVVVAVRTCYLTSTTCYPVTYSHANFSGKESTLQ